MSKNIRTVLPSKRGGCGRVSFEAILCWRLGESQMEQRFCVAHYNPSQMTGPGLRKKFSITCGRESVARFPTQCFS